MLDLLNFGVITWILLLAIGYIALNLSKKVYIQYTGFKYYSKQGIPFCKNFAPLFGHIPRIQSLVVKN